jgi:hypothetical protein
MSLGKFFAFLETVPGINPSAITNIDRADVRFSHASTDYVELVVTVDGLTFIGTAPTIQVPINTSSCSGLSESQETVRGWQAAAEWHLGGAAAIAIEPEGIFRAVEVKDFLKGTASVVRREDEGAFLLASEVALPAQLCQPEEEVGGSCTLLWLPGDGGYEGWPCEQLFSYWLPLNTPPTYVAANPQGWTTELEAAKPANVAAYAALMAEIAQAAKASGSASRSDYEAALAAEHRKISGFESIPAVMRRTWHHEATAAFSAARKEKLGVPTICGFFHPKLGVEWSLFNQYLEGVGERFECADGTELPYLVIGDGPADMAVVVRAKTNFDLTVRQDFGWTDGYGTHVEYYDPAEGYIRSSRTGRTFYTLGINPDTRIVTVK